MKLTRLKVHYKHMSVFDSMDKNLSPHKFFIGSELLQMRTFVTDTQFKLVSNESLLRYILVMEFFSGQKVKNNDFKANFTKSLTLYLTCRDAQKYNFLDICLNSLLLTDKTLKFQKFSLSWETDFFIPVSISNKFCSLGRPTVYSIFLS